MKERYDALAPLGGPYLDVGCSGGDYVFSLADAGEQVHGFDVESSPGWSARPQLFSLGSALSLAYPDSSFHTVYSFEVMEHLEDPQQALREMVRVSNRNVLVSVPNCDVSPEFRAAGLTYNHFSDPTHVQFFTEQTLAGLMQGVGLEVVYIRRINRVSPEKLFFESQGLPRALVSLFTRAARANPWSKRYEMTLLALGLKT